MEKELKPEESLRIITDMIAQARDNFQGFNFYFLLWGWVVAIANFGHFVLENYLQYPRPYLVWIIAIPAYIITMIYGYRRGKEKIHLSHLDKVVSALWMSFGVSMLLLVIFGSVIRYNINPVMLLMAAFATTTTGVIIRFRPLILGGISFWVTAAAAYLVEYKYQYPVGGLGIILGYLIPGYLLKYRQ